MPWQLASNWQRRCHRNAHPLQCLVRTGACRNVQPPPAWRMFQPYLALDTYYVEPATRSIAASWAACKQLLCRTFPGCNGCNKPLQKIVVAQSLSATQHPVGASHNKIIVYLTILSCVRRQQPGTGATGQAVLLPWEWLLQRHCSTAASCS